MADVIPFPDATHARAIAEAKNIRRGAAAAVEAIRAEGLTIAEAMVALELAVAKCGLSLGTDINIIVDHIVAFYDEADADGARK